jgi:hypothetical protein
MVGIEDQPIITRVTATLESDLPQLPPTREQRQRRRDADELVVASQLPAYAVIGIRSKLGAGIALAWARSKIADVDPDIEWKKHGKHGSTSLVRIRYRDECDDEGSSDCDVDIFYALTTRALVVALREGTLRRLLDELRERSPKADSDGPNGQFVAEFAPEHRGALWTVASWYLETEALRSQSASRATAEALLRGAPDLGGRSKSYRDLALTTFGAVPVTPDGALYRLAPEGVVDPARGSRYAPVWPPVPVPGSPVEALLGSVQRMRWETAFDDEGQTPDGRAMRSLHARVTLALASRR